MNIHGIVISHEYGCTVFLGTTKEKVKSDLFEWVVDNWSDVNTYPAPKNARNKDRAIKYYFNNTGGWDSYNYFEEKLEV